MSLISRPASQHETYLESLAGQPAPTSLTRLAKRAIAGSLVMGASEVELAVEYRVKFLGKAAKGAGSHMLDLAIMPLGLIYGTDTAPNARQPLLERLAGRPRPLSAAHRREQKRYTPPEFRKKDDTLPAFYGAAVAGAVAAVTKSVNGAAEELPLAIGIAQDTIQALEVTRGELIW